MRIKGLALSVVVIVAQAAVAHPGPRIWLSIVGGKVTTHAGPYPPGAPANYQPAIVFSQAMVEEDDVWFTEFPGFQRAPGGTIPVGATFRYNIVGPLLWYNDNDPNRCPFFEPVGEHFGQAPDAPGLAITNELFQTQYVSTGFVAGDLAFAFNGSAGDHNHLTYTLLGDGVNPGGGTNGIYAVSLQLTRAGSMSSETFFLLMGKNASATRLDQAMTALPGPRSVADLDCDGDADLDDARSFQECMAGPSIGVDGTCVRADMDDDGDVDLRDFAVFDRCQDMDLASTNSECRQ